VNFTYVQSVRGCYYLVVDELNEYDASRRCVSLHPDAHLVVITSAQEQAALDRLLYPNLGEYCPGFYGSTQFETYIPANLELHNYEQHFDTGDVRRN